MSESTWRNGIEVYTHNGMCKCWTCGQRLAYWEEPWELAERMSGLTHRRSTRTTKAQEDETTCPHCDMETSQTDLTAGECLAEHRRG